VPRNQLGGDRLVPERHEMILIGCLESGAEEWSCPHCGRRMLLRWPPVYERLITEHGDVNAIHVGGKGGVQVGDVALTPAPNVLGTDLQWLRDNGIDWEPRIA
jgi:hypothetical protein